MLKCVSVWLCLCVLGLVEAQLLHLSEGDVCKEENGKKWTCKTMDECPKFQEDIKKRIRPTSCAFINDTEPLICCEPTSAVGTKSKQMCEKYGESVYSQVIDPYTGKLKKVDSCPDVEEPLLRGRQNALPREYPHMAAIGYGEEHNKRWLCGGSLISERYVLSAAHCTDAGYNGLAKWARLGEYDIRSAKDDGDGDARPRDYEIIERINHPNYSSVVYNDIALYKLKDKVEFNDYIRPICLNTERQITRSFAIAPGWTKLEHSGRFGGILQRVNLTFIRRAKCSEYFPAKGNLVFGLEGETMICAGNWHSYEDTCKGDSGGPLQVPLKVPHCMYTQIGIASFGKFCGTNQPVVYTRVSHFVEWIEGIVWP